MLVLSLVSRAVSLETYRVRRGLLVLVTDSSWWRLVLRMRWWSISPALSDGISRYYGGDSMLVMLPRSWWLVAGSKSPIGMPAGEGAC